MPLNAKDYVSGSCAGGEISSLSSHKNAMEAMLHFCKMVLGMPGVPMAGLYGTISPGNKFPNTASHYVFIAGPEEKSAWKNYGTEFAKFIVDNKLGLVATLPPTLNRKYHPTTNCQIWIWQPDQKALETWWVKEGAPAIAVELEKQHLADEAKKKVAAEQRKGTRAVYAKIIAQHTKGGKEPTMALHHAAYIDNVYGPSVIGKTITINFLFRNGQMYPDTSYQYQNKGSGWTIEYHSGPELELGKTYQVIHTDGSYWLLIEA